MLVSDEKIREDIPHEPADEEAGTKQEWMEFTRQPWAVLALAQLRKSREAMANASALGADAIKAFVESQNAGDDDEDKEPSEPNDAELVESRVGLAQYDLGTLIHAGIKAWSYDAKVTKRTIDYLDARTAEWAGERIVELSRPGTLEEEGKVSSASTDA